MPSTVKANPSLYLYLIAFILFNISIRIFMTYLILYYEVSLGMKDYVFIMAPAIVLASVVTALWGKVYDKKGFPFSSWLSLLWLMAGYILLFIFKTTALVFVGSLLMMCGYLSGMAVFGAKTIVGSDGTTSFVPNVNIFLAALVVAVLLGGVLALVGRRKKG